MIRRLTSSPKPSLLVVTDIDETRINHLKSVVKASDDIEIKLDTMSRKKEDLIEIIHLEDKLKNIKDIDQVIQPKYVFRLDLSNKTEDELLASFNQKTRYNIRLAIKKGVTVRTGTKEDLQTFYNIMKETGSRDNFFIRTYEFEEIEACFKF